MISIENAEIKDAKRILDINQKAFNDEMQRVIGRDGGPPGYDSIDEHLRLIEKFIVYKIKLDNEVIGSFFLIPHTSTNYSLESLCIYPEYQKKGYGYKTLELMEKKHPEVTKWNLGSFKKSKHIQKLYEKFGYKKIDEDQWEFKYEKLTPKPIFAKN